MTSASSPHAFFERPAGASHWTPRQAPDQQQQCVNELFHSHAFQAAMQQNSIDPTRVTNIKAGINPQGRPIFTVINTDNTETSIPVSDANVQQAHTFLTGKTNQLPVYPAAVAASPQILPAPITPIHPQLQQAASTPPPAADWLQAMAAIMREFKEMHIATVNAHTAAVDKLAHANSQAAQATAQQQTQIIETLVGALRPASDAHIRAEANATDSQNNAARDKILNDLRENIRSLDRRVQNLQTTADSVTRRTPPLQVVEEPNVWGQLHTDLTRRGFTIRTPFFVNTSPPEEEEQTGPLVVRGGAPLSEEEVAQLYARLRFPNP